MTDNDLIFENYLHHSKGTDKQEGDSISIDILIKSFIEAMKLLVKERKEAFKQEPRPNEEDKWKVEDLSTFLNHYKAIYFKVLEDLQMDKAARDQEKYIAIQFI